MEIKQTMSKKEVNQKSLEAKKQKHNKPKLWDAKKAILTSKFIVKETYINEHEKFQITSFTPQRTSKRRIN